MGKGILFYNTEEGQDYMEELSEYLDDVNIKVYRSEDYLDAIKILHKEELSHVLVHFRQMGDLGFINYINEYRKDIKLIIHSDHYICSVLSIINKGKFQLIEDPVSINQFKDFLETPAQKEG